LAVEVILPAPKTFVSNTYNIETVLQTKTASILINSKKTVEECDATMFNSSNLPGSKKLIAWLRAVAKITF
jgi:hypothetical protein